MDAGAMIRSAREARGLGQGELADLCHLSRPYLSQLESGKKPLTAEAAKRIAPNVGLDPAGLVLAAAGLGQNLAPTGLAAARALHRLHHRWEADKVTCETSVDVAGTMTVLRTFEGCRPIPEHGGVASIRIADRASGGTGAQYDPPIASIVSHPSGLNYSFSSRSQGIWRVHELLFEKPWTGEDRQAFTIQIKSTLPGAFATTEEGARAAAVTLRRAGIPHPARGRVANHLQILPLELRIVVRLPEQLERPGRWGYASWPGAVSMPEDVVESIPTCDSLSFSQEGSSAELRLVRPLDLYSYCIWWTMPSEWRVE